MKTYIGTKEVLAKPMNRKEYNDYRAWELPSNEDGDDEGYLVEYVDSPNSNHPNHPNGYISWSPKDIFEEAYRPNGNLTFGHAVRALKQGKRVRHGNWDEDTFIFMQVPADIHYEIVPNMQSLPQSVKDEFERRFLKAQENGMLFDDLRYSGQIAMVLPDNRIKGYSFSPAKVISERWTILD